MNAARRPVRPGAAVRSRFLLKNLDFLLKTLDLYIKRRACLQSLLSKTPQAIETYLYEMIFPETMEFQQTRLCANGQELGGTRRTDNVLWIDKWRFSIHTTDGLDTALVTTRGIDLSTDPK